VRTLLFSITLALFLVTPDGRAQEVRDIGTDVTIELINGDIVSGNLKEWNTDDFVIDSPFMGLVRILRVAIKPPPPVEEPEAETGDESTPWSGTIDVSATGKTGNTEERDYRVDLKTRHEDEKTIDTVRLLYEQSWTNNELTDRRVFATGRREWELEDTDWRAFLEGSGEDDKFKNYAQRYAIGAGGSYPVIATDMERLDARVGLGTNRRVGGDDNDMPVEGIFGADYFVDLKNSRSFSANLSIYPDLGEVSEYRANSLAEFRIIVDPEADHPWTVTLGAEADYDVIPDGDDERLDFRYYFGAGFAF
jgi:hypothetical protein